MNPTGAQIAAISDTRSATARTTGCTEWDNAGIRAALLQADGPTGTVMAAAHLAAEDPGLNYPSVQAFAHHWPKNGRGDRPALRWVPCGEHPAQEAAACPDCRREREHLTPEQVQANAAEVRAAIVNAPRYEPPGVKRARALEQP